MPLNSAALVEALTAAELAASGPATPEAIERIRRKNESIAEALRIWLLSGDVNTTITATVSPGIPVVAGVNPGVTTGPGAATGTGIGKIT